MSHISPKKLVIKWGRSCEEYSVTTVIEESTPGADCHYNSTTQECEGDCYDGYVCTNITTYTLNGDGTATAMIRCQCLAP